MEGCGGLVDNSSSTKPLESDDTDSRCTALRATSRVGNARQTIRNSLNSKVGWRSESLPQIGTVTNSVHIAKPEVVQQGRAEGMVPSGCQCVILAPANLFTIGPDNEITRVRNGIPPLIVKHTENLIRLRNLVVDPRIDSVGSRVERLIEAQQICPRVASRRVGCRPHGEKLLRDWTDLCGSDPIKSNRRACAWRVDLLACV